MTDSSPDLLVLHAVRLLGFADTDRVAARFGLDRAVTEERLEDARAAAGSTARRSAALRAGH